MKIRMGFVSNSSSSSFVIFVKKSDFDKIQATLSDLEKDILAFIEPKNVKAFDMDLVKISYLSEELEDGASCLFEKIVKLLKRVQYLSHEEDF